MSLKNEAKWLSDKETLQKHISKMPRTPEGFLKKTDNKSCTYMRVDLKNADRFVEEYNVNIKKEKDWADTREKYFNLIRDKKWNDATELLCNYVLRNLKIYTTKDDNKPEFWVYEKGVYVPQGKTEVKIVLRELLGKWYSKWIFGKVIDKIEIDTVIDSDEFFKTNYLYELPVQNGILNIIEKKLYPFDEEKIFFNKLPVVYNPENECPTIDKHFEEVLKTPDDKNVLYEVIGFILYKEYFLEKMLMFVGNGRNGKGKTIDLIRRFIGIDNCSGVPLSSLIDNSFRVSELFGKMVNLAGDLSNTSLKDTGMLKQTTGRDLIGAKRKFLNDIKFVNYAKHIFACNELPKVYDKSKGFWSRWMLFEFPYEFISQNEYNALPENERKNKKILDPHHIDKISSDEELSGLLNKALEGLDRILRNKTFSYSTGSDTIKKYWMRKADSFLAFCEDNIISNDDSDIEKKELRKIYHDYCKNHGVRGCSDKAIAITLQELFGVIEGRKYHDGVTTYYYEGISINPSSKYYYDKGEL